MRLGTKPLSLLAVGKVASEMAKGARSVLFNQFERQLVIGKGGEAHPKEDGFYLPGDHPIPGIQSLEAGAAALQFAKETSPNEKVVVLLSGGASALMESLREGVDLEEFRQETKRLMDSGADIFALNRFRKSKSLIKAGGLGEAFLSSGCKPENIRCLVLSDVYGNDLDTIGSGPMRAPGIPHIIIGDNRRLLESARIAAKASRIEPTISDEWLDGEAKEVGKLLAKTTKPGLTIFGGEPVVKVVGDGIGGRCTEVALAAAIELQGQVGAYILAANSDGTDGNAKYAFAYADGNTVTDRQTAEQALANNDSFTYLNDRDCIIHGSPGLSNVNDLYLVYRT